MHAHASVENDTLVAWYALLLVLVRASKSTSQVNDVQPTGVKQSGAWTHWLRAHHQS
jgi:hypothetical protein